MNKTTEMKYITYRLIFFVVFSGESVYACEYEKMEMEYMKGIGCGLQQVLFIVPCIKQYKPLFSQFCDEVQAVSNVQMVSHGIHGNQIRWLRMKWEPLENTYSDGMALRLGSVNSSRPSDTYMHQ